MQDNVQASTLTLRQMSELPGFPAHVTLKRLSLFGAAALLAGCGKFGGQSLAEAGKEQWPMINRYCTDCHNAAELAGVPMNVPISQLTEEQLRWVKEGDGIEIGGLATTLHHHAP